MKSSKIFISDLDGTLLQNDATLSNFSKNALVKLLNDGLNFTVASARSYQTIKPKLDNIPFKLPVIEFNGSFITDFKTGKHLTINQIQPAIVGELFQILLERNIQPFVSLFNGVDDKLYYQEATNDGMRWYIDSRQNDRDPRLEWIGNYTETKIYQVVCINIIERVDFLENLQSELGDRIVKATEIQLMENAYNKGWYWLTFHAKEACKSLAIEQILHRYDFDRENLTVFGDNTNDINMFKLAGKSVAVGNACEELKAVADEVIDDNGTDAVARYLLNLNYL